MLYPISSCVQLMVAAERRVGFAEDNENLR